MLAANDSALDLTEQWCHHQLDSLEVIVVKIKPTYSKVMGTILASVKHWFNKTSSFFNQKTENSWINHMRIISTRKSNFHFCQMTEEWVSQFKEGTTWRLMTYKDRTQAPSVTQLCMLQIDRWQIPSTLSITTLDSNRSKNNIKTNSRLWCLQMFQGRQWVIMFFRMLLCNKFIRTIHRTTCLVQKELHLLKIEYPLLTTKCRNRHNLLIMKRIVPLFKGHLRCSLMGMIGRIRFSQDN